VDFDAVASLLRGVDKVDISRGQILPAPANRFAVMRCIENDAVGNVTEYFYDSLHRLVLQREFAGRAIPNLPTTDTANRPTGKLRDSDPDFYETRWEYNRDSLCRRVVLPRGNSVECLWERDLNPGTSPLAAGNLRWTKQNTDDAFLVLDATSLRTYYEHDPRFGSDPTAACAKGIIKHEQAGGGLSGKIVPTGNNHAINTKGTGAQSGRVAGGGDNTPIIRGSARKGWDGTVKGNAFDGRDDDCNGFVTRIIDPRGNMTTTGYDAKGNPVVVQHHGRLLEGSDSPVVNLAYNTHGQLTATTNAADGNGYRSYDVYLMGEVPGTAGYGYLIQTIEDASVTGFALSTTFEYDTLGRVIRVVDPNTNDWLFTYNQLDQCVRRQTPKTDFGTLVRYSTDFHYDANDNLVLLRTENRDETGTLQPNSFFDITYEYDLLDRLVRVTREIDEKRNASTEYAYDGNDNCTHIRSPVATDGTQPDNVVQSLYDERNLLFRETRAPGTAAASSVQLDYDMNGNLVCASQGLEGTPRVAEYAYDGLDRRVRVTDAMGNVFTNGFDANGNVTASVWFGELSDLPGTKGNRRLAETTYTYDSLDRLVRRVESFFDIFTGISIADGGSATTFDYARNGQLLSTTDDRTNRTSFAYDTASRLTRVTDAKSNVVAYAYDPTGNVVTQNVTNKSDVSPGDQVFVIQYQYDSLNRLSQSVDNVGNTHLYAYDSRGHCVSHLNPRENETVLAYDGLGRCVASTR